MAVGVTGDVTCEKYTRPYPSVGPPLCFSRNVAYRALKQGMKKTKKKIEEEQQQR